MSRQNLKKRNNKENQKPMKRFLFFILLFYPLFIVAQEVIVPPLKPYRSTDGKIFWNKTLPFYLHISSTPQDTGFIMYSIQSKDYTNPAYFDTEGENLVRTKFAVDTNTRQPVMPQQELLWEIFADGIAPVSNITYSEAQKFVKNDTTYFGPGLTAVISATDEMSGLENQYVSVNKSNYEKYLQTIKFDVEGQYFLQFYATDNVGNMEVVKNSSFILDKTAPSTYHNITGVAQDNIISPATVVYLTYTDNLSGVNQIFYAIDNDAYKLYNNKNIPISHLPDGVHVLHYYSIDKVGNKEIDKTFEFYLDKTAPILASDILGDRFIVDNQIYFSGRTKLKLTAVDNKAGVKEVLFSIDNEEFGTYSQPFYLPSVPGIHVIKYFAVDNMVNQTAGEGSQYEQYLHNVSKIYVDLTGPSISYAYSGENFMARDTMFITSETSIILKATDLESGLQKITYSVDNNQEELKYEQSFNVAQEGFHKVEFFGYDNVNNRNKSDLTFFTDNTGPEISYSFSIEPFGEKDGLKVFPDYLMLYLSATDKIIGTDNIFYSLNGAAELKYSRFITGFIPNSVNVLQIRATDKLQNKTTLEIKFFVSK